MSDEEKPRLAEVVPLMTAADQEALQIIEHMGAAPEVIAAEFGPNISGYVTIAWDRQGQHMLWSKRTNSTPVITALLPAYVAEVVRADILTEMVVEHRLRERLR